MLSHQQRLLAKQIEELQDTKVGRGVHYITSQANMTSIYNNANNVIAAVQFLLFRWP